ncbi:INO80 complex subunit E [Vulpes lagopus]
MRNNLSRVTFQFYHQSLQILSSRGVSFLSPSLLSTLLNIFLAQTSLKYTVGPPDYPVGGPLTFPGRGSGAGVGAAQAPLPPPKMTPPTILSAVPRQMFSDAGSGDDALDGDDDLVIDIPE